MTAVGCDLKVTTRSSSRCWRARRRHARWSRRSRETGYHDLRSGDRPLHLPAGRLDPGAAGRAQGGVSHQALSFLYIASALLFILGLKGLSSPRWARRGMFAAEVGMFMAIVGTLFHHEIVSYRWIAVGLAVGS